MNFVSGRCCRTRSFRVSRGRGARGDPDGGFSDTSYEGPAKKSETIRRHQQVAQSWCQQVLVSELSPLKDRVEHQPDILIFSHRQNLLTTDRRALELIGYPDQAKCEPDIEIRMALVCELRHTIRAAMDHRRAAGIWGPLRIEASFL